MLLCCLHFARPGDIAVGASCQAALLVLACCGGFAAIFTSVVSNYPHTACQLHVRCGNDWSIPLRAGGQQEEEEEGGPSSHMALARDASFRIFALRSTSALLLHCRPASCASLHLLHGRYTAHLVGFTV